MFNILYLIVTLLVLFNLIACAYTVNIGNNGVNRCSGKHANPINSEDIEVIEFTFPELKFKGLREFPLTTTIFNKGHTVVVQMTFENDVPTIAAGPLQSAATYQFQQFEFYRHRDSEVDMELHVIFFNTNYTSFEEARLEQFGVAAIAASLRITSTVYEAFWHLSKGLVNIREPFKAFTLPRHTMSTLGGYLTTDLKAYYSYVGSLMVPDCNEDVIWMDLIDHIEISMETFKHFEALKTLDGSPLSWTSQPLQNPQVFKYVPPMEYASTEITLNHDIIPLVDGLNRNPASKLCVKHSLDFIKILSVVNIIWTIYSK